MPGGQFRTAEFAAACRRKLYLTRTAAHAACPDIGISTSTFHRVVKHTLPPDLVTFGKILAWLGAGYTADWFFTTEDIGPRLCLAASWTRCDDGRPHVHGICTLPAGHRGRWHEETRDAGADAVSFAADDVVPAPAGPWCAHDEPGRLSRPGAADADEEIAEAVAEPLWWGYGRVSAGPEDVEAASSERLARQLAAQLGVSVWCRWAVDRPWRLADQHPEEP